MLPEPREYRAVSTAKRSEEVEMYHDIVQHVSEYPISSGLIALFILFVISSIIRKKRRVERISSIPGFTFFRESSFAKPNLVIAVDKISKRIAVSEGRKTEAINPEEIIKVSYSMPTMSNYFAVLTIETKNEIFSRVAATTFFREQRLAEIAARINALLADRDKNKPSMPAVEQQNPANEKLIDAVQALTSAVAALASRLPEQGAASALSRSKMNSET